MPRAVRSLCWTWGTPVKIDDLARNLIKLSGHVPDVDIKIKYTGLRPGKKLYEEKLMMEEGCATPNRKILIGRPIEGGQGAVLEGVGPAQGAVPAQQLRIFWTCSANWCPPTIRSMGRPARRGVSPGLSQMRTRPTFCVSGGF